MRHLLRTFLLLAAGCALPTAPLSGAAPGGLRSKPLAPPSGPAGHTLFRSLDPEQTAIVTINHYDDPRMWWELYQEFSIGAIGTGVAMADYDRDGNTDVFVVNKTRAPRLYRNLGDWHFEDVTEAAGLLLEAAGTWSSLKRWIGLGDDAGAPAADGGWNQGAAFADVNNDGWPDLYLCRLRAPNRLYINRGDGTFSEEAAARGLDLSDASGMAVFADYDRDGWLDVYIQTNLLDVTTSPDGQPDHLFHNNGDGTFTEVTAAAGIDTRPTQGHSAVWWDYDGDLWPDLYVANDFAAPDFLYRNNRDGTFTDVLDRIVPRTPYSSMGSDLGDIDNDGRIDFLVTDMAATSVLKDLRGMADTRARRTDPADGIDHALQFERNTLFLNTGTDRFLEAAHLTGLDATDWTWSPRFEDIDNDGRLDLLVTNGMVRELHNADLLARIMTAETPEARVGIMKSSPVLAERNLAYRNLGDLSFAEVGAEWGFDLKGVSFGSALGDLDGDGDLDVVFTNYDAPPTVLRNDSQTGHRVTIELEGNISNRFGIGAYVRLETADGVRVRSLSLARGYLSTSQPIAHFGLGEETVIRRLTIAWPSGRSQTFTDLPADHHYTITEPSDDPKTGGTAAEDVKPQPLFSAAINEARDLAIIRRESTVDETTIQPLLPQRFNRSGPRLATGDLNGDGAADIVLGGTTLDPASIVTSTVHGAFRRADLAPPPAINDGPILIADFNGDGFNDVLIAPGGIIEPEGSPAYAPRLYRNHGDGVFGPSETDAAMPSLGNPTGAACATDFDRDGAADLFLGGRVIPGRYPHAPASALFATRDGRFVDVTDQVAPGLRRIGMVTAAVWSDVDRDGFADLVVALDWGGIRLWRNQGGKRLVDISDVAGFSAAGTGRWYCLATADFNGDGIADFAVGNLGLNTAYHASPSRPAVLLAGPFGSRGRELAIEARYDDDGILHPWRTRNELASQIRSLARRFRQNDAYADASLGEILGEAVMQKALRLEATELRSGILLSQPNGRWVFEPLPRRAQVAPIRAFAAADFNGDGHADLAAVENDYSPAPSIGPFDGGLGQLLLGDGDGGFGVVGPAESGIVFPGDGRDIAAFDLDGDGREDLIVTRSGAPAVVLKNSGGVRSRASAGPTG